MDNKLLTDMVAQFRAKHGKDPAVIYVHPVALVALAIKESVGPVWNGIPVKVIDCQPLAVTAGNALGVYVVDDAVRCFDL